MVRVDEVVETKYPPGDKVSTDPTGDRRLQSNKEISQQTQTTFNSVNLFFKFCFQENTFLYIPNSAVGAIIGQKGSHIRSIIRFSGSSVKIAPLNSDQSPSDQSIERRVTILGTPEAQWKVTQTLAPQNIFP